MIRGHAAMRAADEGGSFHLVDLGQAGWPLVARCGESMPGPLEREVRSARYVPVDAACLACIRAVSEPARSSGPAPAAWAG